MRREFPILYKVVSVWLAVPLLGFSTYFYVARAIHLPANEIYSVCLTALGVTAALSGICFTMVSNGKCASTAQYAGEKFLHSTLLLLQSLFLVYIRDASTSLEWIQGYATFVSVFVGIVNSFFGLVSSVAAVTWYHGFTELNEVLWKNWECRILEVNNREQK